MPKRTIQPLGYCHGVGDTIMYHDLSGRFLIELERQALITVEGTYEHAAEELIALWRKNEGVVPAFLIFERRTVQVLDIPPRIFAPQPEARTYLEGKLVEYRTRAWLLGEGMTNCFKIMAAEAVLRNPPINTLAFIDDLLANPVERQHLLRWLTEFSLTVNVIARYALGDFNGLMKGHQPIRRPW